MAGRAIEPDEFEGRQLKPAGPDCGSNEIPPILLAAGVRGSLFQVNYSAKYN